MTPITTGSTTRARRHVALAYPLAVPWMTAFVRGVMDYGQRHGGWTLTTSPPSLIGAGEDQDLGVRDLVSLGLGGSRGQSAVRR